MSQPHTQLGEQPGVRDPERPVPKAPEQVEPLPSTGGTRERVPQEAIREPGQVADARTFIDWRQKVPGWTAAVLAGLFVAELAQVSLLLRGLATEPPAPEAAPVKARPPSYHPARLIAAHLFGFQASVVAKEAVMPPAPPLIWALSGIIATRDPASGVAILGEQGKPLHVYRSGATLAEMPGAHLAQVFPDHVILDIQGRMETLQLPQQRSSTSPAPIQAAAATPAATVVAQAEVAPAADEYIRPTPVQSVLASLNAEPSEVNGRLSGMRLHPGMPMQRRYGFRDGDVVTTINGVDITNAAALAGALKSAGDSVALTYIRDGVQETVNMPVNR